MCVCVCVCVCVSTISFMYNYLSDTVSFSSSFSVIILFFSTQQTVSLSNTDIGFVGIIHNFGFIFDSSLSVKQHIIKTCNFEAAYIDIRHFNFIRQYLTEDSAKAWVSQMRLLQFSTCRLSTDSHQTTQNMFRTPQLNSSLNLV